MPKQYTALGEFVNGSTAIPINAANLNNMDSGIDNNDTRLVALEEIPQNTQTGTAYTLVLADRGKVVEMDNAAANTVTVPPNASVAFPIGTIIGVYRAGAGQTTIAAGTGVTVRNAGAISAQYGEVSLRKRALDEWVMV